EYACPCPPIPISSSGFGHSLLIGICTLGIRSSRPKPQASSPNWKLLSPLLSCTPNDSIRPDTPVDLLCAATRPAHLAPYEAARMGSKARPWPDWWQWELEFTPHLLKRMFD